MKSVTFYYVKLSRYQHNFLDSGRNQGICTLPGDLSVMTKLRFILDGLPARKQLHELFIVHVKELIKINPTVGELAEGTLLLDISILEQNKKANKLAINTKSPVHETRVHLI